MNLHSKLVGVIYGNDDLGLAHGLSMMMDWTIDWLNVSSSNIAIAAVLAFGTDAMVNRLWLSNHHDPVPSGKASTDREESCSLHMAFLFGATQSIALSARVYLGLLAFDLFLVRFPIVDQFRDADGRIVSLRAAAPTIAVTVWIGLTMCTIKRIVLLQLISGKRLGRVVLLDRVFDLVIYFIVALCVLDALSIDVTIGIQTVLSAGGIGALIFSLAAKDLAEQIVGGFALGAWDTLNVGDKVKLSNGVEGFVREIGLRETIIEGYDNIKTRIPNSQMTTARICNLSKVKRRREQQIVRFRYADLKKVPDVLNEITEEIRLSCPKLSAKKSGLLAVLKSFETDHVAALVRAHFDIPPATVEGLQNRHDFLMAIARAMERKNVAFALPIRLSEDQSLIKEENET